MKNILNSILCLFFHKIETIENCSFIDKVTKKSVGKFKCEKCNKEFLANNKRSFNKVYVK